MHRPLVFVVTAILVMMVSASVGEALWLSDTPPSIGTSSPVSVEPSDQQLPAIAHNSTANEYLVVWQDTRRRSLTTMSMLNAFRRSGELLASAAVISAAADAQSSPSVVWNAIEDEYLVVWTDAASDS